MSLLGSGDGSGLAITKNTGSQPLIGRATLLAPASRLAGLTALFLSAVTWAAPPPERGIALGLFSADAEQRYTPYLDEIRAQGATHVALVTVWYQRDVQAEELRPRSGYTVSEDNLRRTIAAAHARGLKVMLFPIVGIEVRRAREWRGRIKPRRWDRWFMSYGDYVLHMAEIAAQTEVEVFSVGSELLSTEKLRDHWEPLLRRVRAVYPGPLLYSANWDHFEPVSFWDLVDVMGVTGYYELTKERSPSRADLVASWRRWQEPLVKFSRARELPLVFTEIGYPSLDGTNIYPWDETRQEAVDLEEQLLCYQAFVAAWDGHPALRGVYFWNWFGPGGTEDGDYSPRGKLAAAEIRRWYSAPQHR